MYFQHSMAQKLRSHRSCITRFEFRYRTCHCFHFDFNMIQDTGSAWGLILQPIRPTGLSLKSAETDHSTDGMR